MCNGCVTWKCTHYEYYEYTFVRLDMVVRERVYGDDNVSWNLMHTLGQCSAIPMHKPFTMPALTLNKSSRVMPGLRGTPAGIMTKLQPFNAFPSSASPTKPST